MTGKLLPIAKGAEVPYSVPMTDDNRGSLYWMAMTLSVILQFMALYQQIRGGASEYPENWNAQYTGIIMASVILTALIYILPGRLFQRVFFILRYILVFIVYLPSGFSFDVEQTFAVSIVLDQALLLGFPQNILFSLGSFFSLWTFSAISRFHTQGIVPPSLFQVFLDSYDILLIAFFVSYFKRFHDLLKRKERRLNNLQETINKLTDANTGFQHYVKVVEVKSTEEERNRIIRELHDSLGYAMTSIIMLSESGMKQAQIGEYGELEELLKHINHSSKTGLTDIRIALRIMKPKKRENLSPYERLKKLVSAFEKATNVKITLEFNNIPSSLRDDVFHLIFRLVQEGMINSFRHGTASEVKIYLFDQESERMIITISDNGSGFKELSVGLGLKGLEERLKKIGGDFTISNTTSGVTLRAVVPLTGKREK